MTKTKGLLNAEHTYLDMFGALDNSYFGFVSDFELIELPVRLDQQNR